MPFMIHDHSDIDRNKNGKFLYENQEATGSFFPCHFYSIGIASNSINPIQHDGWMGGCEKKESFSTCTL